MVPGNTIDKIRVMLQLLFAYAFAAGTSTAIVYLARQNRKQGWRRPAPKFFGVEIQDRESGMPLELDAQSAPDQLLPQLLNLNHALAAHGAPQSVEVESATPELVASRRV